MNAKTLLRLRLGTQSAAHRYGFEALRSTHAFHLTQEIFYSQLSVPTRPSLEDRLDRLTAYSLGFDPFWAVLLRGVIDRSWQTMISTIQLLPLASYINKRKENLICSSKQLDARL